MFAQGSRSGLSYLMETTYGTTPTGNFKDLPYNTHSLDLTKDRVQSAEIRTDRMSVVDRHGNRRSGGDVVVELASTDYDEILEALMFNDWATSVGNPDRLSVGTTLKSMSIEDRAEDIDQYRLHSGVAVSQMAVSMASNQMINTTFTMVGKDMIQSGTGKTIDPSTGADKFDAYSGDLAIGDVGSATSMGLVSTIDFTVNNAINPTFVIGDDSTPFLEYGRASVEGTFTAYFENADLIDRFLNEVESELTVGVNDPSGNNLYTFGFPRIKVNGAAVPVGGETSRMITVPFVALKDDTEGTNFYIERPETV
jgi:hypothetical protein